MVEVVTERYQQAYWRTVETYLVRFYDYSPEEAHKVVKDRRSDDSNDPIFHYHPSGPTSMIVESRGGEIVGYYDNKEEYDVISTHTFKLFGIETPI